MAALIPLLSGIASAALPVIGDVAKSAIPEIGKLFQGPAKQLAENVGDKFADLSPAAKDAFCGCKKEKKKVMDEDDYEDEEPLRRAPIMDERYGYYMQGNKIGLKPRRKAHLRADRRIR